MRRLTCLTASLLGVAAVLARPAAASAEGDQNWQTCVGTTAAPNEWVTACEYDPADAYSWNNRGQARMRLGDKPGAIAALEISPGLRAARDGVQRLGAAQ